MNQVNYATMSDQELKKYFLAHRHDKSAFQAYLERSRSYPRPMITKVGDPDFDVQIQDAINQKLQARKTHEN